MEAKRIMMAAISSGSGKTLLTCALIGALKKQNKDVVSCKCGPDYIDPMFHRQVLGIASENLDTFFTNEEETIELLSSFSKNHEIVVMEGVMGLFDGLGGTEEIGSSYHLAKVTKTPIILVVDVHGMGRTMIPVIQGILAYDTDHLIQGIILNRISKGYFETIKSLFEKEISVPLIGFYENHKELKLESRHLGLCMPEEIEGIHEQLGKASSYLKETIDLTKILEIAAGAEDLKGLSQKELTKKEMLNKELEQSKIPQKKNSQRKLSEEKCLQGNLFYGKKLRLAIARDEAFCFYYEANLRALENAGIELVSFSPVHDKELPEDIQGIYLGGGYPELYAKELSENQSMLSSIQNAVDKGIFSIAECGGFLYLHQALIVDGVSFPMVGVIEGVAENKGKLVRFGYVTISERTSHFLPKGSCIKGHEFHYFDSTANGSFCEATKPTTGKTWECIHVSDKHWWGFAHLYFPSSDCFVENIRKAMNRYLYQ